MKGITWSAETFSGFRYFKTSGVCRTVGGFGKKAVWGTRLMLFGSVYHCVVDEKKAEVDIVCKGEKAAVKVFALGCVLCRGCLEVFDLIFH